MFPSFVDHEIQYPSNRNAGTNDSAQDGHTERKELEDGRPSPQDAKRQRSKQRLEASLTIITKTNIRIMTSAMTMTMTKTATLTRTKARTEDKGEEADEKVEAYKCEIKDDDEE